MEKEPKSIYRIMCLYKNNTLSTVSWEMDELPRLKRRALADPDDDYKYVRVLVTILEQV